MDILILFLPNLLQSSLKSLRHRYKHLFSFMKQEKIYNVNIIKFNGVEELSEVVKNLGGKSWRKF